MVQIKDQTARSVQSDLNLYRLQKYLSSPMALKVLMIDNYLKSVIILVSSSKMYAMTNAKLYRLQWIVHKCSSSSPPLPAPSSSSSLKNENIQTGPN